MVNVGSLCDWEWIVIECNYQSGTIISVFVSAKSQIQNHLLIKHQHEHHSMVDMWLWHGMIKSPSGCWWCTHLIEVWSLTRLHQEVFTHSHTDTHTHSAGTPSFSLSLSLSLSPSTHDEQLSHTPIAYFESWRHINNGTLKVQFKFSWICKWFVERITITKQCFGPRCKCITTNDLILSVLFIWALSLSLSLAFGFSRISLHIAIYKMHQTTANYFKFLLSSDGYQDIVCSMQLI